MGKNFLHYWDDIRKTLVLYSLVPALALLLIGYPMLYLTFMHTLDKTNENRNIEISQELETTLEWYADTVNTLAERESVRDALQGESSVSEAALYEQIYTLLNQASLRPDCFVADASGEPLLSTRTLVPDYLDAPSFYQIGFGARMRQNPHRIVVERCAAEWGEAYSLCVGRAVETDGQLVGYVVLDLSEDMLQMLIRRNTSSASAITDRFGYLFAGNVSDTLLSFNKLASPLRNGEGKVAMDGRTQFVSASQLWEGQVCVYTILDISYWDEMFVNTGLLLLGVAAAFTGLLLVTAQNFAHRKSKILDDMVSAMRNVRYGDLNTRLEVASQDEFGLFAEEYNRMLTELNRLMRVNQEVARQTVITEIKQLESQFNPHFLYNTLGTIKYMISSDPAGAQKIIHNLSEILRYSIRTTHSQTRLEEDLLYTESYLQILQYRFRTALRFSVQIDTETLDCMVPKLVMQPVIENAINYGFRSNATLTIDICTKLQDGSLLLTIQNDGISMEPERLNEVRRQLEQECDTTKHIGLYNIHRRIQLLYREPYGVRIESAPETGTTVIIWLPARRGGEND